MSALYLEDIPLGASRVVGEYTLTEAEIIEFADRWDPQPFHLDHDAAAASVFGELVACAAHLFSIISWLVSQDEQPVALLAGLGASGMGFPSPGRVGDRLRLRVSYTDARPSRTRPDAGVVSQRLELTAADDRPVMWQDGAILVARRPGPT